MINTILAYTVSTGLLTRCVHIYLLTVVNQLIPTGLHSVVAVAAVITVEYRDGHGSYNTADVKLTCYSVWPCRTISYLYQVRAMLSRPFMLVV